MALSRSATDTDPLRSEGFASNINAILGNSSAAPAARRPPAALPIKFLNGEKLLIPDRTCIDCTIIINESIQGDAKAVTTNYRLVLLPNEQHFCHNFCVRQDYLDFPLQLINRCDRIPDKNATILELWTKDYRYAKIVFNYHSEIYTMLYSHIFQPIFKNLFAFQHVLESDRAFEYDIHTEFARFGVKTEADENTPWKLFPNLAGQVCNTYPAYIATCAAFAPENLKIVAAHRIKSRLPVLTFVYKSGGSLWRAAAPKNGNGMSRGTEDENYINLLKRESGSSVHIFDARPFQSSMFKKQPKGRFEKKQLVADIELTNLFIEPIESIGSIYKAIIQSDDSKFYSTLQNSGWDKAIHSIMYSALLVCDSVRRGSIAIVYCNKGWDRTPQINCLVQMCLDSYYRTIDGFATLVEKEWGSFGHPFSMRLGHWEARETNELAPVFLQFLECVYQLITQYPTHFEFTERFLLEIMKHLYSCRFGNFLVNSVVERHSLQLGERTVSFWTYIYTMMDSVRNPYYQAFQDETIWPELSSRRLKFWSTYFFQWNSDHFYHSPNMRSASEHCEILMRTNIDGMNMYKDQLTQKDEEIQAIRREIKGHEFTD